jgi:drug/metabolite transporter (DMT)-like permease
MNKDKKKDTGHGFFKELSSKRYFPFLLMILCTLLNTVAQYFLKVGTTNLTFDVYKIITNFEFVFGCAVYGISSILLVVALKYGDLSVIYPLISITYIWVTLVSYFFLHESLGLKKTGGIILILGGVALITKGGAKKQMDGKK